MKLPKQIQVERVQRCKCGNPVEYRLSYRDPANSGGWSVECCAACLLPSMESMAQENGFYQQEFARQVKEFRTEDAGEASGITSRGSTLMTRQEVRDRLFALVAHYKMTSDEILEKAKAGTLPPDPHFSEWLILLDRGDLIAPGLPDRRG